MGIAQKLVRRKTAIRAAPTDASANQPPQYLSQHDGAKNIAGDVVDYYYPDRAPIGGGIEDPRSPKPEPLSGPNATY